MMSMLTIVSNSILLSFLPYGHHVLNGPISHVASQTAADCVYQANALIVCLWALTLYTQCGEAFRAHKRIAVCVRA